MDLVVETQSGALQGKEKDGVFLFAGVPYAAPPVGDRRFKAPEPMAPWQGIRDALKFSPAAPQIPSGGLTSSAPVNWDEDCLYLNVATPGLDDKKRPVMVWIHGGAYRTGQGAIPWYNGASFARQGDIVAVSINYRLGALGFTDLSRFGEDYASSGSNGTMDQIAALEWVKENIACFGGDPDRVTIAGESAGGFSVTTLLTSPLAQGLFCGAIPQSGAGHHTLSSKAGHGVADLFLGEVNCADIESLKSASVEDILAAQQRTDERLMSEGIGIDMNGVSPFYPVEGTPAVPVRPVDAAAAGMGANVRVLVGSNKDETTMFNLTELSEEHVKNNADRFGGGETLLAAYRSAYPEASHHDIGIAMSTDFTFRIPCLRLAEARESHPESEGKTWMYFFAWESRSKLKSTHALEIPFVFNNLDKPGVRVFLGEGSLPQDVADVMHDAWTRFIRDGDPGWQPYELSTRSNMKFDDHSEVVSDPDTLIRPAWDGIR